MNFRICLLYFLYQFLVCGVAFVKRGVRSSEPRYHGSDACGLGPDAMHCSVFAISDKNAQFKLLI